jgi:hypothetical protein
LAALRLGKRASLVTRSRREPGLEHHLTINWDDYAKAEVVEDVTFEVTTVQTDAPSGTEIKVSGISAPLSRRAIAYKQRVRRRILCSNWRAAFCWREAC